MNIYSEDKMYESYSSEVERMKKCIDELQQENKILRENAENNDKVVDKVNWENMLLKKKYENAVADYEQEKFNVEELKKQLKPNYYVKGLEGTLKEYQQTMTNYENQQKEFIKYLEDEKDRLARECSNIYEDSLGKTRLVNEDIFNEVDKILSKYKSIIGVSNENNT